MPLVTWPAQPSLGVHRVGSLSLPDLRWPFGLCLRLPCPPQASYQPNRDGEMEEKPLLIAHSNELYLPDWRTAGAKEDLRLAQAGLGSNLKTR